MSAVFLGVVSGMLLSLLARFIEWRIEEWKRARRHQPRCRFPGCAEPRAADCRHCGDALCAVHIAREAQCIYRPGGEAVRAQPNV